MCHVMLGVAANRESSVSRLAPLPALGALYHQHPPSYTPTSIIEYAYNLCIFQKYKQLTTHSIITS